MVTVIPCYDAVMNCHGALLHLQGTVVLNHSTGYVVTAPLGICTAR